MVDLLLDIDKSLRIEGHILSYPEDCCEILNKYTLKILSVNIRSVQHNFDNFLLLLARLNTSFDAIVFSECWISDRSTIKQIEGYNSFNTQKYINKAGGVIIYVGNKWVPNVTEPDIDEANGLIVEVPNVFTLVGIYRSPSVKDPSKFITSLENNLESLKRTPCLLIAGDINIDILHSSTGKKNSSNYLNLLAAKGLISCINSPTHLNSCIDHIFVSAKCHAESAVCLTDLTDHSLTMVGVSIPISVKHSANRYRLKVDYDSIRNEVSKINWKHITHGSSLDEIAEKFTSALSNTIKKHSHKVKISHSKFNIKPWMTPGLIRCSKHRDKLHLDVRRNPNDNLKRLVYTRYRNFYNKLLKKLKNDYEKLELEKNKNSPKKLWKTINTLSHRAAKKSYTSLEDVSVDVCNDHFSSVGQNLANTILIKLKETEESLAAKATVGGSLANSFYMSPTDGSEILQLIRNVSPDSSPGLDDISNKILKKIGDLIAEPLAYIFNQSMESGAFPTAWKIAVVVPIHKSGSRSDPSNYRPISLLGSISKLLERIVNRRLVKFLETQNVLTDRQFGFRQGRSTEDAVSLLTNTVVSHLVKGQKCIGVFLDLAKAFDSISIPILTKKLEAYGIRGNSLSWFTQYLSGRQQCVRISERKSSLRPICFGVPQGSILGPTLFLLYINDIATLNIVNADIVCYADDTALIFWGRTWPEACSRAEEGMALVSGWLRRNLLTLNTSKTKFLCFHKTAASAPVSLDVLLIPSSACDSRRLRPLSDNQEIHRTASLKYLGVVLDERLTFRDHIVQMSGRVRKLFYVMKNLRESADSRTLKMVYMALGQSLINYCILAWGGVCSSFLIPLERAQRGVLKVALNKPMRYSTTALYKETGVLSVRRLYIMRVAVSVHKSVLISGEHEAMLKKRIFKLPVPARLSTFSHRFAVFLFPHIYNKLVKICKFKHCSAKETKVLVSQTLVSWTYEETEKLLKVTK